MYMLPQANATMKYVLLQHCQPAGSFGHEG